ncbi:MAG: DUF4397 domain-containing protein [Clostridium sp.]|uniref:DUF4397 domain-containing protein n=1 Tax=Clostridium sp. TaxID=1506 RepID=UPI003F2D6828
MMFDRLNTLPKLNASIRLLHASTDISDINIFANGKLLVSNLKFSMASNYLTLQPGTYNIEIFKSSNNNKPIFSYKLEAIPTMIATISICSQNGLVHVLNLKDNFKAVSPDTGNLRFINLSPNAHLLNLSLWQNKHLFKDVEFLERTSYYPLTAKTYTFFLSSTSFNGLRKRIPKIALSKNENYTLYIIGLLNGKPSLGYILLKDR